MLWNQRPEAKRLQRSMMLQVVQPACAIVCDVDMREGDFASVIDLGPTSPAVGKLGMAYLRSCRDFQCCPPGRLTVLSLAERDRLLSGSLNRLSEPVGEFIALILTDPGGQHSSLMVGNTASLAFELYDSVQVDGVALHDALARVAMGALAPLLSPGQPSFQPSLFCPPITRQADDTSCFYHALASLLAVHAALDGSSPPSSPLLAPAAVTVDDADFVRSELARLCIEALDQQKQWTARSTTAYRPEMFQWRGGNHYKGDNVCKYLGGEFLGSTGAALEGMAFLIGNVVTSNHVIGDGFPVFRPGSPDADQGFLATGDAQQAMHEKLLATSLCFFASLPVDAALVPSCKVFDGIVDLCRIGVRTGAARAQVILLGDHNVALLIPEGFVMQSCDGSKFTMPHTIFLVRSDHLSNFGWWYYSRARRLETVDCYFYVLRYACSADDYAWLSDNLRPLMTAWATWGLIQAPLEAMYNCVRDGDLGGAVDEANKAIRVHGPSDTAYFKRQPPRSLLRRKIESARLASRDYFMENEATLTQRLKVAEMEKTCVRPGKIRQLVSLWRTHIRRIEGKMTGPCGACFKADGTKWYNGKPEHNVICKHCYYNRLYGKPLTHRRPTRYSGPCGACGGEIPKSTRWRISKWHTVRTFICPTCFERAKRGRPMTERRPAKLTGPCSCCGARVSGKNSKKWHNGSKHGYPCLCIACYCRIWRKIKMRR